MLATGLVSMGDDNFRSRRIDTPQPIGKNLSCVIKFATPTAVPNLVHTRLRRLLGKWAKYNHNYYLLIYISLLVDTSRGQTPRLILKLLPI